MGIIWAKQPRKPNHEAKKFFACQGLVEELFLLLIFTCSKLRKLLEVLTSNLKDLLKLWVGIKWAKQPRKPNHEEKKFFACQGLVEELFSIHMSNAQKDFVSANKQLERPPEALGWHKMGKPAWETKT